MKLTPFITKLIVAGTVVLVVAGGALAYHQLTTRPKPDVAEPTLNRPVPITSAATSPVGSSLQPAATQATITGQSAAPLQSPPAQTLQDAPSTGPADGQTGSTTGLPSMQSSTPNLQATVPVASPTPPPTPPTPRVYECPMTSSGGVGDSYCDPNNRLY